MATQLTADDAKQSLTAHLESKGVEIFCKYGPQLDEEHLQRLLLDRSLVRYPVEIVYDAAPLLPGEFAHPLPKGERPEDGFTMAVHPRYAGRPDRVAFLVLYQLVAVNYGEFASAHDAEGFGAAALGLTRNEYYNAICDLADEIAPDAAETPDNSCTCGGH